MKVEMLSGSLKLTPETQEDRIHLCAVFGEEVGYSTVEGWNCEMCDDGSVYIEPSTPDWDSPCG